MINRISMLFIYRVLAPVILCCVCLPAVRAQKLAVKTNLLYDATTTPNIGVVVADGEAHFVAGGVRSQSLEVGRKRPDFAPLGGQSRVPLLVLPPDDGAFCRS